MVEAMELRDIISGSVPTKIKSDATVADALVAMMERKTDYVLVDRSGPKMADEGVSRLAVFDKENFLGFVSDLDVLRAASAKKPSKAEKGAKA